MSTTVTFRTEEELKEKASKIYESLGMNLSTALNLFMRQTVIKQKFPCSLDLSVTGDLKDTYPKYFFELIGEGNDLGFDEEPEDLKIDEVNKF